MSHKTPPSMSITYFADSLEDIAKEWDQKAVYKRDQAKSSRTQRRRNELLAEAEIWRQAADILRRATLKKAE